MDVASAAEQFESLHRRFESGKLIRREVESFEAELKTLAAECAPLADDAGRIHSIAENLRKEFVFRSLTVPEDFQQLISQMERFMGRPVSKSLLEEVKACTSEFIAKALAAEAENENLKQFTFELQKQKDLLSGYRDLLDKLVLSNNMEGL